MSFSLIGNVEITHLNVRKQKAEDDERVLAIDVKCRASGVDTDSIAPLVGVQTGKEVAEHLFNGMSPRFSGLTDLESWAEFKEGHRIKCGGFEVIPNTIRKFHFSLRSVGDKPVADLGFGFTVVEPPTNFVNYIADNLDGVIKIEVEHDPELDFGDENQDPQKEAA